MASLREVQRRETRERLYDAAMHLFRERGYDNVSVDEVAVLAGTAKGTFFNHFPTKDHILVACLDRYNRDILNAVEGRNFRRCEDAALEYGLTAWRIMREDRELAAVVVRSIFSTRLMFEADQTNVRRYEAWALARVRDGIESGELRADVDQGILIAMIAAVLSSVLNAWALGLKFDVEDQLRRRMAFVFDAARPGTGMADAARPGTGMADGDQ